MLVVSERKEGNVLFSERDEGVVALHLPTGPFKKKKKNALSWSR